MDSLPLRFAPAGNDGARAPRFDISTAMMRLAIGVGLFVGGLFEAAINSAVAQSKGGYRSFESWSVGCDNTRLCRLYGFASEDGPNEPVLVLHREAQGKAGPVLEILWPDTSPAGEISLSADGQAIGKLAAGAGLVAPEFDGRGHRIADEAVAAAILAALRKATELVITAAGEKEPHRIKLKGASAAMLYMDEFQQRLGTRTALVRVGDRAPETVPAPPRLPEVKPGRGASKPTDDKAPPALMKFYLAEAEKACDRDAEDAKAASVLVAHRLSATITLYGMQCWRAAYNFGTAFYLVERGGKVSRAVFPPAYDSGRKREADWPAHVLGNGDFDEETLTVSYFHKGRGIGDCGESGAWRWDGKGFAPVSADLMPNCRGLSPESWLSLYRSKDAAKAHE